MNKSSCIGLVRVLALALLASRLMSCIVVPVPAKEETTIYGRAVTVEEVKSLIADAESPLDVKAKLGEPMLDFGPQSVFIYGWTVDEGKYYWIFAGSGGGMSGSTPGQHHTSCLLPLMSMDAWCVSGLRMLARVIPCRNSFGIGFRPIA